MRFISCGKLDLVNGAGIDIPTILKMISIMKDGVVNGDLFFNDNFIKDGKINIPFEIKGVEGSVYLSNQKLTTLEGCPEYVSGGFFCNNNKLTTLEGCPKKVGGNFSCSSNDLKNLEGAPKYVGNDFECNGNELKSLKGCPEYVGGSFHCSWMKKKFKESEIRAVCNVKGNVYL